MAYFFALISLSVATCAMSWRFDLLKILRPTAIQILFVSHVLAQFIPSIYFCINLGTEAAQHYLMATSAANLLIPFGGILADLTLRPGKKPIFYAHPYAEDRATIRRFSLFFFMYFCFCLIVFVFYVRQANSFPIFDLLMGVTDAEQHSLARREATTAGRIYGIGLVFFFPVLFVLSFLSLSYLRSRWLKWMARTAVIMSLIYNAWPGSKIPIAMLFVISVFAYLIRSNRKGNPKKRFQILLFCSVLVFISAMYPILVYLLLPVGEMGLGYLIEATWQRIFFKPAENTLAAFTLYSGGQYTGLASISTFASLAGVEHINLSKQVAIFRGFGEFTNSPPASIGTFYAQGGWPAIFIGIVFAAYLFRAFELLLHSYQSTTPIQITAAALLLWGAFRFSWANFHNLLFSETFLPLISLILFWSFGATKRQSRVRKIQLSEIKK